MISIAVCDDNPQFASLLTQHLKKLSAYKIPPRVDCRFTPTFGSATEVLEYLNDNTIDVLFLDIDMPKMNGFKLAEILCEAHPDTIIIFVSSYEEFVYSSFEYCPFRFLRKAHLTQELDITFQKVIEKCILNNETILFNTTEGEIVLRVKDITFFEGQKNYFLISTVSGKEYKCRGTMESLEGTAGDYDFFRIHSAYIVNLEHIESINNDGFIVMKSHPKAERKQKKNARLQGRVYAVYKKEDFKMIDLNMLIEFGISLFDAVLCVYFISKFNDVSLSPRYNKLSIPAVLVIFGFSIINDLFLAGFNLLGTFIFLVLYILYAISVVDKKYIKALVSACIFEVVFVLLSSLLYLIITFIINDYDQISQGANGIFRYTYVIIHKIALFVVLKIILMVFSADSSVETKHGIIAFLFSFATILGLGATMYIASVVDAERIQLQTIILTVAFTFSNVALYVLIYQMQKYQRSKYELRLLQEKIAFEEARHSDATAIWSNIRKVQHDMKQHITIISGFIDDNKIDSCKEYLNELLPKAGNIGNLITSDNKVLDYLINSKLAPLTDTKIVISGSIGDLSDIKEFDLVCLMGNILDNAIEALEKIESPFDKRIELLFVRQNSNRIIICKNTIECSVLSTNKELKTTKKSKDAHGYGTKIIAKIVSDYHGIVDYFEEFNMFGVQVILPEP